MRNLNLISLNNFVSARGAYYGEYGIRFLESVFRHQIPKLSRISCTGHLFSQESLLGAVSDILH